MKKFELIVAGLLALGAVGHLAGTFAGYEWGSETFVWSLSASCFVFLIVVLQVLRILRPEDRPVRVAATIATILWIGLALAFGAAVGNVADPRALIHALLSAALVVTTLVGLRGRPAYAS